MTPKFFYKKTKNEYRLGKQKWIENKFYQCKESPFSAIVLHKDLTTLRMVLKHL